MSYWNKHPELLEEVTIENLPIIWRDQVEAGSISLNDVPSDIMHTAMMKGTEGHFADMADSMEEDR